MNFANVLEKREFKNENVKVSPMNILLRYVGKAFPDLVKTRADIFLKNTKAENGISEAEKADYINTVKALQRMVAPNDLIKYKISPALAKWDDAMAAEFAGSLVAKKVSTANTRAPKP